jgi:hypothetical protein
MTSAPIDWQLTYPGQISDLDAATLKSFGARYNSLDGVWIIPGSVPESKIQEFATFPAIVETASKRKTKKYKDPNAPKKGLTPYFQFMGEYRSTYVADNPTESPKEVVSGLAAIWRQMSDDQKAPYVEMANQDAMRYNNEMDNHLSSLNDKVLL